MRQARVVGIGVVLLALAAAGCNCAHPTDEELIRNFQAHKADFQRLHDMLAADTLVYLVSPRQVWGYEGAAKPSEVGLSEARLNEYRRIFEAIGARWVEIRPSEPQHPLTPEVRSRAPISVHVSKCGVVSHGSSEKGYSFAGEHLPNVPVVPNTDFFKEQRTEAQFMATRVLEGEWSVFYIYRN
jgi:hypothetical protein